MDRRQGNMNPASSLRLLLAASLLALLAGLTGLPLQTFAGQQTFERTYPLAAGGRFLLENVTGSVQVEGWDRDAVEVRAVKITKTDPVDLSEVRVEVQSQPGQVSVRTRYPKGEGADVAVEYHIYVPSRVLLSSVKTVNGSVSVHGIEGMGELHSVNGDVEVLKSSGCFSAQTTNGNLRLELSGLQDGIPMNLETVNGSVLLGLPSTTAANLTVLNLNGEFSSELPVTPSQPESFHGFRGKIGLGGGEIRLRTINGGVHLIREPGV
jgi:DUF4097 and DUF4098 domain-containing protein YvlB